MMNKSSIETTNGNANNNSISNGANTHANNTHANNTHANNTHANNTHANNAISTNATRDGGAPYSARTGERFIALEVAYELIRALRPLVPVIERHNHALADQLFRAASSVAMNLAEGQRSQKGNQHKHYSIAHGSANEVKAALHVASAWGWLDESEHALVVMDRLLALLWRLTHRGPRAA